MRSQYAVDLVNVDFNNATGESLYHIVNESPISFFTTYIVPKSSPFIVTLNRAILSAREFGFLSFVNMKIRSHLDISRMKRYMKKSLTFKSTSAITMGHMRHIFTFYLVCISICCFVFILEILHKRISTRRAPIPFAHWTFALLKFCNQMSKALKCELWLLNKNCVSLNFKTAD